MTSTQKLLVVLASPLIVSIVLVGAGLASHHTEPIGAAGFLLLFICFNAFAFADRFLKRMRAFRAGKSFDRLAAFFDSRTRHLIEMLATLPIESAVLIRGAFLSLSFWIVDLFVALCDGGISSFFEQINKNILLSVLSLVVASFETVRGKSISRPGFLTRAMSTLGAFQFFRGLYLLGGATLGREVFTGLKQYLSNPLWFIFAEERYVTFNSMRTIGLGWTLMFFGIMQLFMLFPSLKFLLEPRTEDNIDGKNFALAIVLMSCWLLTLPIFEVGLLIYLLVTHTT